ncbi:TSCPD domain-containing protein [Frateuria aurantia]
MAIKIQSKIKSYSVVNEEEEKAAQAAQASAPSPEAELARVDVVQMHESLERPDTLVGSTYKIKSPLFEHALYVTINDIVLNPETVYEQRRPFEIFINSKNMDHFQWIVALTRILSAVFRKGGDVTFLVEEMKAVFDPRGGYFKAGGIYMPSIVAEIGGVIEQHMKSIGLIHDPELDASTLALIAEKRAAYEAAMRAPSDKVDSAVAVAADAANETSSFPPGASLCAKCNTQALVLLDGCQTCLNCGYSKCG